MKNIKSKIKCECDKHYLELRSFDGNDFISRRMCYSCGKWLTHKDESILKSKVPSCAQSGSLYKIKVCKNYIDLIHHAPQDGDVYYLQDYQDIVVYHNGKFTQVR